MKKEESVRQFTQAVILLAKMFPLIKDDFFAQKLQHKMSDFILAYSEFLSSGGDKPDVAQSADPKRALIQNIDALVDHLDYFQHLSAVSATPLLSAKYILMRLKVLVMQTQPAARPEPEDTPAASGGLPAQNISPAAGGSGKPKDSLAGLNENQEKIFGFIKNSPDVRAKDVIDEFSVLSERTVKRNLKELLRSGMIQKRSENRAVYYSARGRN